MLQLTSNGNYDVEQTYPKTMSWLKSSVIVIVQYLLCYLNCSLAMYFVMHEKLYHKKWYYYVNLASVIIILYITFVTFMNFFTCSAFQSNFVMSFRAFMTRGRYMIGLFRRGSYLRHCVVNPIIDGAFFAAVVASTITFTDMPENDDSVSARDFGYLAIATVAFEFIIGNIRVKLINNGNIWSTEMIVRPICMKIPEESDEMVDPTKESPQEDPIVDSGPYYRTFIV